jgi:glycosyltransferase involved in cell wall biosynthesis
MADNGVCARPTRIALLLPDLTGGGVERTAVSLAQGFLDRGLDVDLVLCRVRGPLLAEVPPPVRLVPLRPAPMPLGRALALAADPGGIGELAKPVLFSFRPPSSYRMLPSLARYLRRERPAALISAFPFENLLAISAKRLAGAATKVIVTERNTTTRSTKLGVKWKRRYLPGLVRRQYPMADAIVAVSDGVADELAHQTGLPRDQIVTIHNAVVSQSVLAKAAAPVPHPWFGADQPPVILGVGRLTEQKDFPTLIRAFARIRAERPARLVIVGEGRPEARAELMHLATELGCVDDLSLPGFTHNPFCYMANAAVFVLSSLHEGLPGVLIQALACGAPVVSTDCPSGPREILEGGRHGRLVRVGDDMAMAEAIREALLDRSDRTDRVARGRQFSVDRAVDRYLALLRSAGLRLSFDAATPDTAPMPAPP